MRTFNQYLGRGELSRRRYQLGWICFAVILLCGWPPLLQAQNTGGISGTISDPSGARVVGATVTILNTSTLVRRSVVTDDQGNYQAGSLGPGRYRVEVEAPGFKKMTQDGITLQVDERLRVDGVLQVGEVSDTVNVSAEGVAVNT
ncbi:MAG TPA: carboxypeptidase-like regulatory domain-containing protein, partial [Terriglobia bacterium]|nr:carboxypeptidase-like regulatory domain-containing protein [Terriglobia bacterium]